ncbi:MAG: acyl-CoA--6-aminopenicillanic acid acyl-transferase, partial [Salegentibacter sp.]
MNLRFFRLIFFAFLLLLLNSCGVRKSLQDRPDLSGIENIDTARIKIGEDHYVLGKNSLFKNKYGIWELYIEGDPLERGLAAGSLTRDLIHKQEDAFMGKIGELVPSKNYRHFLQKMIYWFN